MERRTKKTIFLHTSGEGERKEAIIQCGERGEGRAQKPLVHIIVGGGVLPFVALIGTVLF